MELIAILKGFELLIFNLQFYVALGTISMAAATAWSIKRQGNLYKIMELRMRINSFYIPFFEVFTQKWENDNGFKEKWDNVRPFVRNSSKATQNAIFDSDLYSKIPRLKYSDAIPLDREDYDAWDEFYAIAWKDFRDLDSKLMKLQKTKGTNLPESPDKHNFTLQLIS